MAVELLITDVIRRNNKIEGYQILNKSGETATISSKQLKDSIHNNNVKLLNYKLTSDNRLIKCENENSYYLMNKDRVVAVCNLFINDTRVVNNTSNNTESHVRVLPYDFKNINQWIESRAKFSCARDVKQFFESIGIKDSRDFIDITHCVSLHDTFWIKPRNSNLKWANVSPYRNSYSKVVSTYALDGIIVQGNNKNYFSPVMSTEGSFPHTWKFNGENDIIFIKAGSKYTLGGVNSGMEPFSEYFASQVAKYLGFKHVDYKIRKHIRGDKRVDIVTECKCYNTEKYGSISAYHLGLNSYEKVLEFSKKLGDDAYKTCTDMLFLDCILLNTDRHFGNIEFIVNNDTLCIVGIAPIFDNNYALLPRFIEGYEEFNRNDYIVRDNRTFEELYKLVKYHRDYRSELIKLKKFEFKTPDGVELRESRVKFLNKFLQIQAGYLLKN